MSHTARFLVAPGEFTLDLPPSTDPYGDAVTTVLSLGGARHVGYSPAGRLDYHATFGSWEHKLDIDVDGTTASLFRRPGEPLTLYAVWHLANGYLTTFVDEQTPTLEDLIEVVNSITVTEGPAGTIPKLALRAPTVTRADTRDFTYRDALSFYPSDRHPEAWPVVRVIEEPNPTPNSGTVSEGGTANAFVVLDSGLRVLCQGPPAEAAGVQQFATLIAGSLKML